MYQFAYFIACLCPLTCLAQYTKDEAQAIARFEKELKTDVDNDGINGSISAVIIKKDKVIWAKAFGYANRDTKKLADTGTIYHIASITKTFTATLLMMLVEDNQYIYSTAGFANQSEHTPNAIDTKRWQRLWIGFVRKPAY